MGENLTVAPGRDHPLAADITFTGTVPVILENPHFRRLDGRITQDYVRFMQIGRTDGWIEIEGERFAAQKWFGARDHSWGVRPGQGGYEPLSLLPNIMIHDQQVKWVDFGTDLGEPTGRACSLAATVRRFIKEVQSRFGDGARHSILLSSLAMGN